MNRRSKKKSASPLSRSEIMRRVGPRDSKAEIALRSALHRRGLRFRVNRKTEGIKVDIVFVSARIAVFVDGCFWHGCPEHATYPKSNSEYWLPKLEANKERDARQTAELQRKGWKVIRVWEHDCLPPSEEILNIIEQSGTTHPSSRAIP